MKDKLEDLLYESGLTAQGCWDEFDDYAKQGIEKFAELIVRESIAEMQDAFDMTIEEANHLLDYFGVDQ